MRTPITILSRAALAIPAIAAPKMQLEEEDRRKEAIIDEATPETELAVQQLQLPEGIEATLWAAEPMLANPVAFDFDEQGRLYVAETYRYGTSVLDIRAYMDMLEVDMAYRTVEDRAAGIEELFGDEARDFELESERIRFLEDRDGDSRADYSSEYAAGFDSTVDGIASGVLARKGDVYVTNIPSLLKLNGMDEDGRAQTKEEILHGFGVHFGYTGHDLHGLIVGPDGKLYFSIGDRGANVTAPDGSSIDYPDTGAVYRSNFDGTDLEVVHIGLRNPQELAFDEFGNLFTGDNDCDNGDVERLVHVVDGGDSGWRIGHQQAPRGGAGVWMSEGWWKTDFPGRTKFALPPLFYVEDGPSGIAYYPGTGLSPEYQGHLFITHFKGSIATSGVYSYTFEQDGASYKLGTKKEFLKGILPTDVTFAPDGKFYVLDWVSGWPKSNKGRVYALSNQEHLASDIVKETQALISKGFTQRDVPELTKLLSHPNWNVRLEAQLELASRGESSAETFDTIASDESADLYSRLHATWGLGILAERGSANAANSIAKVAHAEEKEIRAQATKLIGDHLIDGNFELLLSYLEDDSARVRFFAAQSLGKIGNPEAAPALIEAARENDYQDNYLAHAIVMGLTGTANKQVLAEAVDDESEAVRFAALLAYRRLGDVNVAKFLNDSDKEIVFEAARAINDAPIEAAYPALADTLNSPLAEDEILGLRAINAHFRLGDPSNAESLAAYAADSGKPSSLRVEALRQLSTWEDPLDRDRIIGVYQPLDNRNPKPARNALASVAKSILESDDSEVQAEFIVSADALGLKGIADELYKLVLDESKDGAARVAAFNKLSRDQDARIDELITATSQSNASELRLAALPIVTERSPEQAKVTLELMSTGSVEEQRVVYNTLANSKQPFAEALLVKSLDRLMKNEVPYGAQLELINAAEAHESAKVKAAYEDYESEIAIESDPVAPFRFALEGGDSEKGRDVFFNNQAMACIRCHIVYGPGEAAGPNLSDAGLKFDREYLLEGVVAPNATISDSFRNEILTLNDGTTKVGLVTSETDTQVTLTLASGEEATFQKSDIKKRDALPSSMPNIFGTLLSREDLRDVVEFLTRQKTDPKGRSTHSKEAY